MATGVSREKRPLCEAEVSASKEARVETAFAKLPDEVLAIIASKLSDVDLQAFALADNVCFKPALHERAIRVLDAAQRDLRPLSSLIRPAFGDDPSPSGTYKRILSSLYEIQESLRKQILPSDPSALASLNQSLTQITTDFLAEEALLLRASFMPHIEGEGVEWEREDRFLERSVNTLQENVVARLLTAIISASPNPNHVKMIALERAALNGKATILKNLMEVYPISEFQRGALVSSAARNGHASIVQSLLEGGSITNKERGRSASIAARNGHSDILAVVLQSGPISALARGEALQGAAINGHASNVDQVLSSGYVAERDRGIALVLAAERGHARIVRAILKSGPISNEEYKKDALSKAKANGHGEVVDLLSATN